MNILIVGAGTGNKGAYLMLHAVYQQARKYFENPTMVISPTLGDTEPLEKIGYKRLNFPIFHASAGNILDRSLRFPKLMQWLYKILKAKDYYGEIDIKDINLVLDISGYAYSDQFGPTPLAGLQKLTTFYRKRNIPIIIMPQALGPFNNTADIACKAFSKVDLIFCRDRTSFDNVMKLLPEKRSQIIQASDITLSLKIDRDVPTGFKIDSPFCTIVPNQKMLEKASVSWIQNYEQALEQSIDLILSKSDIDILILVHNDVKSQDYMIATKLYEKYSDHQRLHFYQHHNPLVLKRILGQTIFLIGSRFHALASALSSNTPSISTSWAHKYEELFKEYGIGDYSHSEYSNEFFESIKRCLQEETRSKMTKGLITANKEVKENNEKMWASIVKNLL